MQLRAFRLRALALFLEVSINVLCQIVVVHFPGYTGPYLLPGLPATWVPVPVCEVGAKGAQSLRRIDVPLKLAWALRIHKCQGITATHAPCRQQNGARVCSLDTRVAVGHVLEDHRQHLHRTQMCTHGRPLSDDELQDLETMLRQRGVAPISYSAAAWLREKQGASSGAGLLTLMASYRADKPTRKALRDKETSTRKRDRKEQEDMEHGYHEDKIEAALAACGAKMQRCVEHCLREVGDGAMSDEENVVAETWAFDLILRLGFDADAATRALELSSFSFKDALVLLLNGTDI